jgi:hypothetical protein
LGASVKVSRNLILFQRGRLERSPYQSSLRMGEIL